MAELKPCPFCGSEEVHVTRADTSYLPANIKIADIVVICEGCGATGRSETSVEKAIESWNRRYEDGVTFCCECRWFEESSKKGFKGDCKLHKIKAAKNDYCAGAWRRC